MGKIGEEEEENTPLVCTYTAQIGCEWPCNEIIIELSLRMF